VSTDYKKWNLVRFQHDTADLFIWHGLNSSDVQTVTYLDIVFIFRVHHKKATVAELVTKFLVFCTSNEASFSFSQESVTGPHPDSDEPSQHLTHFLIYTFQYETPSTSRSAQ